ncbi:MAG: GTPase Era [Gammaproteobacteria bacterium]
MTEQPDQVITVALVGRTNVGKSSLFNALAEEKLSIVTRKPHTTRFPVAAPVVGATQTIWLWDTPGASERPTHPMQRWLNESVWQSVDRADALLFVVEAMHWLPADQSVLEQARRLGKPMGGVVTKIDRIKSKTVLLPFLAELALQPDIRFWVPVSAIRHENLSRLISCVDEYCSLVSAQPAALLPERRGLAFPDFAAELFRERLMERLSGELPYALHVLCNRWVDEVDRMEIEFRIVVERPGQKRIVVGTGGQVLRQVGSDVRTALEKQTGKRVMLRSWVEIDPDWSLKRPEVILRTDAKSADSLPAPWPPGHG